ncbi:hypothetical protein J6590_076869 [Homalodisca vitripennis]|nr:hypothetical protein J6590_076869 [Homalodisca vitripennis]
MDSKTDISLKSEQPNGCPGAALTANDEIQGFKGRSVASLLPPACFDWRGWYRAQEAVPTPNLIHLEYPIAPEAAEWLSPGSDEAVIDRGVLGLTGCPTWPFWEINYITICREGLSRLKSRSSVITARLCWDCFAKGFKALMLYAVEQLNLLYQYWGLSDLVPTGVARSRAAGSGSVFTSELCILFWWAAKFAS